MPCYMYINGMKQEMDEDLFDQMAETLHQSDNIHNPPTATSTRWKPPEAILSTSRSRYKPDGTYDKKPLDLNYFSKYYQRSYQLLSPVPTADEPSRANPIYQSTVKPTDVLTADVIDEMLNSNLLNNKWCCWERFIRNLFVFVWHIFSTLDVLEHSIETLHAYKKDTQPFQGASLIFCLYVCSSIPATPLFSLLPSCAERPYWHNQCFWCSVLLVSIVLPYNHTGSFQSTQSYNFQYQTHQRYQTLKFCCLSFLS